MPNQAVEDEHISGSHLRGVPIVTTVLEFDGGALLAPSQANPHRE
jgi:hypothetical protein